MLIQGKIYARKLTEQVPKQRGARVPSKRFWRKMLLSRRGCNLPFLDSFALGLSVERFAASAWRPLSPKRFLAVDKRSSSGEGVSGDDRPGTRGEWPNFASPPARPEPSGQDKVTRACVKFQNAPPLPSAIARRPCLPRADVRDFRPRCFVRRAIPLYDGCDMFLPQPETPSTECRPEEGHPPWC